MSSEQNSNDRIYNVRHQDIAGIQARLILDGDLSWDTPLPASVPQGKGQLRPVANAVDLVQWVKGCDFKEASAWISEHFPERHGPVDLPITKLNRNDGERDNPALNAIHDIAAQQLAAMGASEYQVTGNRENPEKYNADRTRRLNDDGSKVTHDEDGNRLRDWGFNLGKPHKNSVERTFSADDVLNSLRKLRLKNSERDDGQLNVYITPLDRHASYIMIDDARPKDPSKSLLEDWKSRGYNPCLVLQSSHDPKTGEASYQMLFRIPREPFKLRDDASAEMRDAQPKDHNQGYNYRGLCQFVKELNKEFGDEGVKGARHSVRLAGFRNMKMKRGYEVEGKNWDVEHPFVKLIHAEPIFCKKTMMDALKCCPEVVGYKDIGKNFTAESSLPVPDQTSKHVSKAPTTPLPPRKEADMPARPPAPRPQVQPRPLAPAVTPSSPAPSGLPPRRRSASVMPGRIPALPTIAPKPVPAEREAHPWDDLKAVSDEEAKNDPWLSAIDNASTVVRQIDPPAGPPPRVRTQPVRPPPVTELGKMRAAREAAGQVGAPPPVRPPPVTELGRMRAAREAEQAKAQAKAQEEVASRAVGFSPF